MYWKSVKELVESNHVIGNTRMHLMHQKVKICMKKEYLNLIKSYGLVFQWQQYLCKFYQYCVKILTATLLNVFGGKLCLFYKTK